MRGFAAWNIILSPRQRHIIFIYWRERTLTWPDARADAGGPRWRFFARLAGAAHSWRVCHRKKGKSGSKESRARLHTLTSAPTSDIHHHQLDGSLQMYSKQRTNHSFIHLLFAADIPAICCCVSTKRRIGCFVCTFWRLISNEFLLWRLSENSLSRQRCWNATPTCDF